MSQTPSVPPFVNRAMKLVLRSPVHGMVSKTILLMTFTGRKSGKTYTTPVSYSLHEVQVTIFTHSEVPTKESLAGKEDICRQLILSSRGTRC